MAQLIHTSGKKIPLKKGEKLNFKKIQEARANIRKFNKASARKPVYTSGIKKFIARKSLTHNENLLIGSAILKMSSKRRRKFIHNIGFAAGITNPSAARNIYKDHYNKAKRTALLVSRWAGGKKLPWF